MQNQNLSYGGKLVGLNNTPTGNELVYQFKKNVAAKIDTLNDLRATSESQEQKRLCSVAITELEGALLWAVKALTFDKVS